MTIKSKGIGFAVRRRCYRVADRLFGFSGVGGEEQYCEKLNRDAEKHRGKVRELKKLQANAERRFNRETLYRFTKPARTRISWQRTTPTKTANPGLSCFGGRLKYDLLPMINIKHLANALTNHAAKCRSAQIVCRAPVAVESWFRIELVTALVDTGVALEHVEFNLGGAPVVTVKPANGRGRAAWPRSGP